MMNRLILSLLCISGLTAAAPTDQSQYVLDPPHQSSTRPPRKLQGKFLHITDIHPDPFYRAGTDPFGEHPCHKGDGSAGYFGAEKTECDSPFPLINATFDWIKENIRDDIDFVVWTGDSARHDNDLSYPRSNKQVEDLNALMVDKFVEVFGKNNHHNDPNPQSDFVIPIIPSFGNNDILPHNIFEPGPNRWTKEYLKIWKKFVPEEQKHSFERGGWFVTEVIPNKLAVFSLNTLYFFESNTAVDGCDDHSEPGYEHFEWLRIQLELFRQRKMKAILTGHVPPARTEAKQNWDETCYQKYTLWLHQYRDVIVGNLFGHMNIDHFMLQDTKELTYPFPIRGIDDATVRVSEAEAGKDLLVMAKSEYLSALREHWRSLPSPPKVKSFVNIADGTVVIKRKKKDGKEWDKFLNDIGGPFAERFSLTLVAPSVVPNFYPSLRIIEYNITGLENEHPSAIPSDDAYLSISTKEDHESDGNVDTDSSTSELNSQQKKKKGKKPKPNFRVPKPPSKSSPPGPAYSPQTFSFLSWTQLYANLTTIDAAIKQEASLGSSTDENDESVDDQEQLMQKHFKYEIEYTTGEKPYKLKDLTVRSWVELAEKIGRAKFGPLDQLEEEAQENSSKEEPISIQPGHQHNLQASGKKRKGQSLKLNKMWHAFVKLAYVSTKSDEELEDEFG